MVVLCVNLLYCLIYLVICCVCFWLCVVGLSCSGNF